MAWGPIWPIPVSENKVLLDHSCTHSFTHRLPWLSLFFFLTFIYFWDRETEHEQGRVRERGRHRIWNGLQALSCQHRARCDAGLELTDHEIMTWAEVGCPPDWATQAPPRSFLFIGRVEWMAHQGWSIYHLALKEKRLSNPPLSSLIKRQRSR